MEKRKRIAVLDLETDPFEYNVIPKPFVSGLYDGDKFVYYWGPDCIARMVAYLESRSEPLIIFAHNGGKFDWLYFLEHLPAGDMRIVNGRIIQARLGEHTLRDSFAIMPFPLADYKKDEIDYQKLHRDVREKNKDEIMHYLRGDLVYLHELVVAFFDEFGDKLTIGSAALKQLQRFHKFNRGGESFDAKFRKDFYFGGRNQVFQAGIIRKHVKIYDVNSMYPDVMRRYLHPIGNMSILSTRIDRNTCFVVASGKNYGAFPVRTKEGSLDFTVTEGRFCTTIHEFQAAEDTGTFKCSKIHKTFGFDDRITFAEFIEHFYGARLAAKLNEDLIHALFYKFVLNSSYGKFAQNPKNFYEWRITSGDTVLDEVCPKCIELEAPNPACDYCGGNGWKWTIGAEDENGKYIIWKAPLLRHNYYNITTGASITGAARSVLLRGIANATNPMYCDTDSIICEDLSGVPINDNELGAWKLEAEGTLAAICGKKLYAVFGKSGKCADCKAKNHDSSVHPRRLNTIKKAHKGARLSGDEILRIASGEEIEAVNPVPNFKLSGRHTFTKRKIKRTA